MSNYTKTVNFATKDNLSPGNPLKIVKGTEIDTEYNNIATAVATKTDNSAAAITGGTITGITDLAVADGGTGASTAADARTNLGVAASGANSDITSLTALTTPLTVLQGGTGVTTSTGTTNVVLSNSPTLVTPALGTPSAAVLTNATGLPISTGVSGLGAGVATLLATPSSANLASAITDETGSGALVFATSPTLVTPILGTPTSGTLTNATGLPISTGVSGLGTGVATFLGTPSSANLISAVTDETGTGSLVFATSPTLVTPALGTPTSGVATNLTGLPLTTGVTGLLPVANGGTATATPSIVAGTNITVTGTWPNQTIAASGGGTPGGSTTQVQFNNAGAFGGITGATSNGTALTLVAPVLGTPASATLTNATGLPLSTGVTGTLPVVNGGTGQTTYTDGQLLIGNTTGNTLTKATLTAGTGITITNGTGAITIAASGGTGDVTGPASSTDNAITRFDSTTGKIVQNSLVTVADDGAITAPQVGSVIPFYYANQAAFPSAATYHGAIAHSHSDGAMYFAHSSVWYRLLDASTAVTPAQGGTGVANNAAMTVTGSGNFAYTRTLTGTTNVTFPTTGTLSTLTGTETLTNKTLTTPVISSISNTGTLTLPTSTDTLVGRATTDTLTNKTLTSPTLTTPVLGTPSSGTLSSCTVDGTDAVGFRNIPQNSQSAAYTLVLADAGKHIFHPSTDANARTFTIPANSSVAYPIGTAITFINMTSQVVTIAITTDTMYLSSAGTTGSRSLAQYGSATAIKMTSTTWLISGSGLT